jgi:virulence factor Mce-like protein
MRRAQRWEQHRIRTALVALALVAVGLYFVMHREVPFTHHYTINAEVRASTEIRVGSPVRIAGVGVGKVTKLGSHGKNGVITMQIEDAGRPVHADAQVHVRQRITLEGNQFVDLTPGSPSAKEIPDGGTIPASQTTTPVQLDQVLGTLDASTRDRLVTTLDQYGTAVTGKGGEGLRGSIKYWTPAYSGAALVNQAALGKRLHDLSSYIGDAGTVADALDSSPAALRSLVEHFDDTTAAFASERAALGQSVQQLPATLSTGQTSLRKVDAMLPAVDRLATDLRSEKGAPPPQQTFKFDTPELQAKYLKAQTAAVEYARKVLDQQGLGKVLKVSDTPLTLDQLQSIVPRTKGALDALTRKP